MCITHHQALLIRITMTAERSCLSISMKDTCSNDKHLLKPPLFILDFYSKGCIWRWKATENKKNTLHQQIIPRPDANLAFVKLGKCSRSLQSGQDRPGLAAHHTAPPFVSFRSSIFSQVTPSARFAPLATPIQRWNQRPSGLALRCASLANALSPADSRWLRLRATSACADGKILQGGLMGRELFPKV